MTMLIAVPTGVKIFNWIGTMWRGSVTFETPMLWAIGFLITFTFGGLTGVILASPPLDFHVSDTYFVVAHFHYVVFGTVVFAMFAGFYFWWPKWTGKMLNERLGKIALLAAVHRLPHDVPHPALDRRRRHAASLPTYLARGRLHLDEPGLDRSAPSSSRSRCCRSSRTSTSRPARRRKVTVNDPWGYGRVARVGDQLPAAAAQLHLDPAHPFGVARHSTSTTPRRASPSASARRRMRPMHPMYDLGDREGEVDDGRQCTPVLDPRRLLRPRGRVYIVLVAPAIRPARPRSSGSAPSASGSRGDPGAFSSPSTSAASTALRAASCPRTASTPTSTTATPEQGHFSPWSWWPVVLAAAAALVVPRSRHRRRGSRSSASPLLLVAIVGWVYEYYRGYFAR